MFSRDFQLFGPQARPGSPPSLREANRYCRKLAKRHYENFTVASWLLPGRLRQHFYNVYAYCRWADDLADETGDAKQSLALLDWWETQLRDCYRGQSRSSGFYCPGRNHPRNLKFPSIRFWICLAAFRQDQRVSRYETIDQLLEYCRRSANPVGRLVLYLGECYSTERAELADSICTGLQLANFCQDVARRLGSGPDLFAPGRLPPLRLYRGHVRPARVQRGISPADEGAGGSGGRIFCVPDCR